MSTDTNDGGEGNSDDTSKIDVRAPNLLLEEIDKEYERRGYTSRSEAIRDALRDWIDPPTRLSEETLEALKTSYEQREQGDTRSANDVRERLGLDD